jgi:hypothetical protein
LIDALQATLKLNWPDKNGVTLREHYEQAGWWEKLEAPEIPEAGTQVWNWYWELDGARGHSGSGTLPISFGDIKDWIELNGANPTPGEIGIIRRLDSEYMSFVNKQNKKDMRR